MSDIVEVKINEQTVYFESEDESDYRIDKVGIKDVPEKALGAFQHALNTIQLIVSETINQVQSFDESITPDEFQLQFGIKISGEYGAVVAKASGEAQLSVTLTYKHKKGTEITEE